MAERKLDSKKRCKLQTTPSLMGICFSIICLFSLGKGSFGLLQHGTSRCRRDSFGLLNLPLKRQGLHTTNNLETHHLCIDGWFYIKLLPLLMILP